MAGADASLYPVKTPDREAHDVGTTTTRHTILGLERGTWLLLAIILAGAALRLFRLGEQSVWFDEASRLVMASSDLSSFLRNAAQDTQPPFFHLTQHFWLKVGTNAFLGRFLPAAMGILLLPLVYRLARELFDQKTALIAAALAALMPYQVYQAQQANLYAMVALLSGLQMWFFWQAVHDKHWRHWLAFGFCTILGLYTHYFSVFIFVTLHLFLLIYRARYPGLWRRLLLIDGAVALAFLPLVGRLIKGTNEVFTSFWLTRPSLLAPLTTLYFFVTSYSLPQWGIVLAMFVTLAALAIGLYELVLGVRSDRQKAEPLLFVVLLSFVPILMVFMISQIKPIFLARALIVVIPAFIVLLGRALSVSRLRSPLPYLYLSMGGLMFLSLAYYYFNPAFAKPPFREASTYVSDNFQVGDVVLHTTTSSFMPFLFYDPPPDHYLLKGDPAPYHPPEVFRLGGGKDVTADEIAGYRRLWLVVALDHSLDYQTEVVADFDTRYPLLSEEDIGGIIIRVYELKPLSEG